LDGLVIVGIDALLRDPQTVDRQAQFWDARGQQNCEYREFDQWAHCYH
jgi:hypothetical protein